MPIYRAQLSVHLDSELPRDVMTITPHFDDHGAVSYTHLTLPTILRV